MTSIETCPVCRLGLTFGPAHLRCRCPAEVELYEDGLDRRLRETFARVERLDASPGPFSIERVSRAAIEALGVEGFTTASVVEYVADHRRAAGTLAAILSERAGRLITAGEVSRAIAAYPVARPS